MQKIDPILDAPGASVLAELLPVAVQNMAFGPRSEAKHTKTPFSRFKLLVIYRDQNCRTYFSWDYYFHHHDKIKYRILDEREGLIKLLRYAKKQIDGDNLISAMIYAAKGHDTDTRTGNKIYNYPLYKYVRHQVNKMQDYGFIEEHRKKQVFKPMKALIDTTLDLDIINGIIA